MAQSEKPERNAELVKLRKQGMSYAKLGREFNISATRARNICLAAEINAANAVNAQRAAAEDANG